MQKLLMEPPLWDLEVALGRLLAQGRMDAPDMLSLLLLLPLYRETLREAREEIDRFSGQRDRWKRAPWRSVYELRAEDKVCTLVKVRVSVLEIGDRVLRPTAGLGSVGMRDDYHDFIMAKLGDEHDGATIVTTPIAKRETVSQLYGLSRRYGLVDILGLPIVALIKGEFEYLLWPMEINAPDSPLQILRAAPDEVAASHLVLASSPLKNHRYSY